MSCKPLITTIPLILTFSVVANLNDVVYIEGVNDDLPVEPGWTGTEGHEQAYRWTAQNTFDLIEIQFHSSAINTCIVRLREDTGGEPGEILREVTYNVPKLGWHGALFDEPYHVQADETYFVTMTSVSDIYSSYLAEGGVHLTYYWTINGTENWNGPYDWAGHRMLKFFSKAIPDCPADLDGDGNVSTGDLLELLSQWGTDGSADIDGDGVVSTSDLLILLANWGPCK